MTYADLQAACRILGLGERSSLKTIKDRHRDLVKQNHPDTGPAGDPEMIRQVNAAYRTVLDYVSAYRYSFAEDEFYEQSPEERIRKQFSDDPVWGNPSP